jgi:hypothetical protein
LRCVEDIGEPDPRKGYWPGLKRLLSYAVSHGHVKNEGFEAWRLRERVRTADRATFESIASEIGAEIAEEDGSPADFVASLVDAVPRIRNEYAHGTAALDSNVLGGLRTVCEIINQIYRDQENGKEQ